MSNLKLPLLLICCFFFFNKSFGQINFVKGYVVLNNNDTLHGFLKQDPEGDLSKRVVFSDNENGNASREYAATDIKAFYFNGGNLFESIKYTDENNLPAVYFAKYILKGYYNLYSFREKDVLYFIIKHQDTTYLLYDDVILSSGSYDTKGNYQNQFLFLARNCNALLSQIPPLRYDETALTDFTKKVNDCVAPGTNYTVAVKPKSKTDFYVYAGGLPLGDKYEYTGRALARIHTPSISKNLSLNAGISYLAHKTTEEVSGIKKESTTNIISAALTMQNNFTTGIIQPYLEAGIGFSYQSVKVEPHNLYDPNTKDKSGFGVDFIIALGVEAYVSKHLAIKADWRYELLAHYPTIGVAYFF